MTKHYERLQDLQADVGREIAVSDWITVDQERIDLFAKATGDFQWIHVDRERAAAGPFGATIAHGFLTLSLLPLLTASAFTVGGTRMGLNYGLNRVRFPNPVRVGSRLRGRTRLLAYEPIEGGAQITIEVTMELEGGPRSGATRPPTLTQLGISRRITDETERQRLRALLEDLRSGEGGFIARTASRGQSPEKLRQERDFLISRWQKILRKSAAASAPALLHQELDTALRVVRELFSPEIDRVLVDDPAVFEKIQDYLESLNPLDKHRVELHSDPEPLFSHFGLEIDWKRLLSPKVWLKCGGYLLFGTTEALTAVDVNTGRFVGRHDLEETILKTNLEAAREIARQLRLRNVGGLIVIDFIDMEQAAHRDQVYQAFLEAVGRDRAKSTILPISALGLLEMTRQRLRDTLEHAVTEACPCCDGTGELLSPLTLVCDLMRQLTAEAREFHGCRLNLAVHPQMAAMLQQEAQPVLDRLAADYQVRVEITEQPRFSRDYYELTHELK